MGIFKAIKGLDYLSDVMGNKEKKIRFEGLASKSNVSGNQQEDVFETEKVHTLKMEEKAGSFGKRSFLITNASGDICYIAKKTGTYKYPLFTLYREDGMEVGSVKPQYSNHKSLFSLTVMGNQFQMEQTTLTKSMYEVYGYGWQIKASTGQTIVCNKAWEKIIQINRLSAIYKSSTWTDTYQVKMLHPENEIAALVVAIAVYVSRRPEYQ